MIIEKPLYPQRATVYCVFQTGGIIGLYIFENEAGSAFLVNGLRYRTIINEFSWPEFFLWGYVKDKVYADAPQSIQEIKEEIHAVIDELEPQMCKSVMENFIKRAWSCKRSRGGHMNIFFH